VYDVVVELGYNDYPRHRGRGSAIFMHVARQDYAPTAGCIALSLEHLLRVLARVHRRTVVRVGA
jgi:L,D-peptidoglycan transpeptidase YkuD (ErfK/YbiS/YcfS/YnhG family)